MTIRLNVGRSAIETTSVTVSDNLTVREVFAEQNISLQSGYQVNLDTTPVRDVDATLKSINAKDNSTLFISEKLKGANE